MFFRNGMLVMTTGVCNQPYEIEKIISQINDIRLLMSSDYPGILNTDRNICYKIAYDIQYDYPYADAEFIVNETEKKCLDYLAQKNINKQKSSDPKRIIGQYYHKYFFFGRLLRGAK